MNMATKQSKAEILKRHAKNLRTRNAMRIEASKRELGADYLLHPDNKGVKWGWGA